MTTKRACRLTTAHIQIVQAKSIDTHGSRLLGRNSGDMFTYARTGPPLQECPDRVDLLAWPKMGSL